MSTWSEILHTLGAVVKEGADNNLYLVGPPLTSISAVQSGRGGVIREKFRMYLRGWPLGKSASPLAVRVMEFLEVSLFLFLSLPLSFLSLPRCAMLSIILSLCLFVWLRFRPFLYCNIPSSLSLSPSLSLSLPLSLLDLSHRACVCVCSAAVPRDAIPASRVSSARSLRHCDG